MSSPSKTTALTKRPASGALMAPPPAPKRIKRPAVVLDEDTYTSAVSYIIRRDFFPGLAETDAQHEYLNALESKDNSWIREAGKKLTEAMTPLPGRRRKAQDRTAPSATPLGRGGDTPSVWGNDTPLTASGSDAGKDEEKKPEVDLNLSLGAFQAKYISEDQESFSKIIDKQNAKKFEQRSWMHSGNRYASKQQIAQEKVIEAAKSKNESQAVTLRPSQDLNARPAAPTMHKHTAYNSLMFMPDSIEDWAPTTAQRADSASFAPPKAVLHHNTRLPVNDNADPARPPSPTISAVRDAVGGRPRLSQSDAAFDGSETPRVNGYAFVDAVAPEPEDSDEDNAPTDLLERFGARADPSPFTIHDSNRREKLHHSMVERIGTKKSGKSALSASGSGPGAFANDTPRFLSAPTPRPGMTPGARRNPGALTPAAQRLFERVGGGTPRAGASGGFGAAPSGAQGSKLGSEWTPTPRVRRKA